STVAGDRVGQKEDDPAAVTARARPVVIAVARAATTAEHQAGEGRVLDRCAGDAADRAGAAGRTFPTVAATASLAAVAAAGAARVVADATATAAGLIAATGVPVEAADALALVGATGRGLVEPLAPLTAAIELGAAAEPPLRHVDVAGQRDVPGGQEGHDATGRPVPRWSGDGPGDVHVGVLGDADHLRARGAVAADQGGGQGDAVRAHRRHPGELPEAHRLLREVHVRGRAHQGLHELAGGLVHHHQIPRCEPGRGA